MGQTNNEDMEHDETYENYRVIKHNGNNDIDTSRISIRIYDPQGPPRWLQTSTMLNLNVKCFVILHLQRRAMLLFHMRMGDEVMVHQRRRVTMNYHQALPTCLWYHEQTIVATSYPLHVRCSSAEGQEIHLLLAETQSVQCYGSVLGIFVKVLTFGVVLWNSSCGMFRSGIVVQSMSFDLFVQDLSGEILCGFRSGFVFCLRLIGVFGWPFHIGHDQLIWIQARECRPWPAYLPIWGSSKISVTHFRIPMQINRPPRTYCRHPIESILV